MYTVGWDMMCIFWIDQKAEYQQHKSRYLRIQRHDQAILELGSTTFLIQTSDAWFCLEGVF